MVESAAAVDGIYACGNGMSSSMGATYAGPRITIGPAIVFAYRAAMHAAQQTGTLRVADSH